MKDKRGNPICPKCGYQLLARCEDKIFCLNNGCEWFTDSKRKEDEKVPDIHKLKDMWN